MKDSSFIDSNILLYTLDNASEKQRIAFTIWREGVVMSTQVVMEFTNVCLKKLKFSKQDAFENALNLMSGAIVKPVTENSVRLAFDISAIYGFNHWDCLIIASALESRCSRLYTEDLQHDQVINDRVRIINPFQSII